MNLFIFRIRRLSFKPFLSILDSSTRIELSNVPDYSVIWKVIPLQQKLSELIYEVLLICLLPFHFLALTRWDYSRKVGYWKIKEGLHKSITNVKHSFFVQTLLLSAAFPRTAYISSVYTILFSILSHLLYCLVKLVFRDVGKICLDFSNIWSVSILHKFLLIVQDLTSDKMIAVIAFLCK